MTQHITDMHACQELWQNCCKSSVSQSTACVSSSHHKEVGAVTTAAHLNK